MLFKRPRIVTFLALAVLIYTGFYWTRFYQATFAQKTFLETLPLPISPLYLQITGLVFGLTGLLCFIGLWQGLRWAPWATKILAIGTAVFSWTDRLLVADPDPGLGNWPFALGITVFFVGYLFLIFRSDDVKQFFTEAQEPPSPTEVDRKSVRP